MNTISISFVDYELSSINNKGDQVTIYLWTKDFTFCLIDRIIDPNKTALLLYW